MELSRIFVGQGVKHSVLGYGVIRVFQDRMAVVATVGFQNGEITVPIYELEEPVMSQQELEKIRQRLEKEGPSKKPKVFGIEEVDILDIKVDRSKTPSTTTYIIQEKENV